jgi:hypothetical protein
VFLYLLTRDLLNLEIRSRSPWLLLPSPVVLVPSLVDMGPGAAEQRVEMFGQMHTHMHACTVLTTISPLNWASRHDVG